MISCFTLRLRNRNILFLFNALTAVGALMTLWFYSVWRQTILLVNGEPLGSERVNNVKTH